MSDWGIGLPVAVCGLVFLWIGGSLVTGRYGVENAKYSVTRRIGSMEVRLYNEHIIASVGVKSSDIKSASNRGFRAVARYIFGGNVRREGISMTSPVQITKPINAEGAHEISFVLPSKYKDVDTLPLPTDPNVEIKKVSAGLQAVKRLGIPWHLGGWSKEEDFKRGFSELEAEAALAGLVFDPLTVKREVKAYDPPWTPFFLIRREVSLHPVEDSKCPPHVMR